MFELFAMETNELHIAFLANLSPTLFATSFPMLRIMIAPYNNIGVFYVFTMQRTHRAIADHDDLIIWLKFQKLLPSDFAENALNTQSIVCRDDIRQLMSLGHPTSFQMRY